MIPENFVLDASVALAWCFEDEQSARTDQVLQALEQGKAIVPAIWLLEVGNALLGAERRGLLTPAETAHFLELLRNLPINVEDTPATRPWSEILSLARLHRLSTYDATYLDLAMRLGLPLATLDAALRQAAQDSGVTVL